jgi:RNA polymerase sigma-70 factor (ECF subfamily)
MATVNSADPKPLSAETLASYRDDLYRYALMQLRDAAQAEEVVQDTLVAALESLHRFAGNSSAKTWLIGILKHKIIDLFRRQSKAPQLFQGIADEDDINDFDVLFDKVGHWGSDAPRAWGNPNQSLEQKQFWAIYEACTQRLPRRTAVVFMLREIMDQDIDDICQSLSITATNCSVLLYRARMALRICLEKNWFGLEQKPT